MRIAFAIALLAFVGTSNAIKLTADDTDTSSTVNNNDVSSTTTNTNTTAEDNTDTSSSNTEDNTDTSSSTAEDNNDTSNTTTETDTSNTTTETDTSNTSTETNTSTSTDLIVLDGCTEDSQSSLRDPTDTSKVLLQGWNNAYSRLTPTADFGWPFADIKMCGDNTIRDLNLRCLTWLEYTTDATTGANAGDLAFQECSNDNPSLQQFDEMKKYPCNDKIGNEQTCIAVKNRASGTCLSGSGRLTSDCDTGVMRRTGIAAYLSGHLRNEGSKECLVPVANENQARVTSAECEEDYNQKWAAFTSGEIKHYATGYCLGNVEGYPGIMSIQPCSDAKEMAFNYDTSSGNGLQLQSQNLSGMAAEAIAFLGQAVTLKAQDYSNLYQYWQFVDTNEWTDAEFTWVQVGCGHGVEMSHSYSEEFNLVSASGDASPASDEYVLSAQQELLGESKINNSPEVDSDSTQYLTETYSQMMNHPSDPTIDRSHLFTCSGEDNCMYRSVMTMYNNYSEDSLQWVTGYTRCMSADPQCPPLTSLIGGVCVANEE